MEKKEIEELVEHKVTEAKLAVAEKRIHFVLWLGGAIIALFGVVLPLWQTNKASDKVDAELKQMRTELDTTARDIRADSTANRDSLTKATEALRGDVRADMDSQIRQIGNTRGQVDNAIQDMHKQFKELAGAQLRKPVLECFVGGSSLEGAVLKFSSTDMTENINIKNIGDARANDIMIRIYSNLPDNYELYDNNHSVSWSILPVSDEPTYTHVFEGDYRVLELDAKELQTLDLSLASRDGKIKPGNYPCLLKVFYQQPEPMKYSFTISISDK